MQTKDWFHEWLEHYVKPASKQKTYILYCELTEQHILPKFGGPCGHNPGQGAVRSVLICVCILLGSSREETA